MLSLTSEGLDGAVLRCLLPGADPDSATLERRANLMAAFLLSIFFFPRTTPATTTAKAAEAEIIPMLVGENTFADDGAAWDGAGVVISRLIAAAMVGTTVVGVGEFGSGDAGADDDGVGEGAARSGVDGINLSVGCRVGEATEDVGLGCTVDRDIGLIGDGVAARVGAGVASSDVLRGAADRYVPVGTGVSPSTSFSSPAAGEGVAAEPTSSITAAISYASCVPVQTPAVQPANNKAPLGPSAMAKPLSLMVPNEPPC